MGAEGTARRHVEYGRRVEVVKGNVLDLIKEGAA